MKLSTTNVKGPVAPKDPTIKRPKIYFMLDNLVTTSNAEDGKPKEIRFLEGRVSGNVSLICPELPKESPTGCRRALILCGLCTA